MKILAIETSCDETAVAIVEATGDQKSTEFRVLGNALLSQIDIHREYGGVFPALAKREHAKNLVPLLEAALEEAELLHEDTQSWPETLRDQIVDILARELGLAEAFFEFVGECEIPNIDAIAVTAGPGLEPALWVGINFAKALSLAWEKPVVAVNHMEGHIMAALAKELRSDLNPEFQGLTLEIQDAELPILALLISGGHTELVVMKTWLEYELLGQTRDDAVGEAFDKVARLIGLPYPGGPEISKLAEDSRMNDLVSRSFDERLTRSFILPRPMLHDATCDFSFAGLKTAVRYQLKDRADLSEAEKRELAREFEDAAAEVLYAKTVRALEQTDAKTLVLGGGVSANTHIRRVFTDGIRDNYSHVALRLPAPALTTDNALMIALAGYYRALRGEYAQDIVANGTLSLCQKSS